MVQFPLHEVQSLNGQWSMRHAATDLNITTWQALQAIDAGRAQAVGNKADAACAGEACDADASPVYPAQVPGNFELDLHAAGAIADPFVGMNMAALYPLENHHVWYATRFEVQPRQMEQLQQDGQEAARPVLRFEGSDCYARYYLNGRLIGESDNALIEHVFPVKECLQQGTNELVVHFRPALQEARRYAYPAHLEAFQTNYESLHVRKPSHAFGWDIMPRALSAGLWRDVALVWEPAERLNEVYLETLRCTADAALLRLFFQGRFEFTSGKYEIDLAGQGRRTSFSLRQRVFFEVGQLVLRVPSPELWWPSGRGEAHLYDVTIRLLKDGREVDRVTLRHGIRQVRIERTSMTDAQGQGEFCFHVNGERLFVMGSNHVPLDAYHSRDIQHIDSYMAMVEDLRCNMLRCWGGNVYEHGRFYDLCDEKGILVWQDFALACAWYPQDEAFAQRLSTEVTQVVRRLRQHACIALWAGDNECDSSGYRAQRPNQNPNRNMLTRQVIPRVLMQHDPGREYMPSSPYIDETAYKHGLGVLPEQHPWGPRDYYKSDYYSQVLCHFASEMGYHGCPTPSSIRRFIDSDYLWPAENEQWLLHASTPHPGHGMYDYRVQLMKSQIVAVFGAVGETLEAFAWQSQCVQAEAKKFFIEFFRTGKWRRTGILWWNLRDGWPQFSDAVVDYYNERKLAYGFIKRSQQPLLLAFREPVNGRLELVACNDTRHADAVRFTVTDARTGAAVLAEQQVAAADAVTSLGFVEHDDTAQSLYWIHWQAERAGAGVNHYLAGRPPFDMAQYAQWLAQGMSLPAWRRTEAAGV